MNVIFRSALVTAGCITMMLAAEPSVSAQGGGGGGRGGGGGGSMSFLAVRSRLVILTEAFTLDKEQKEQVKGIMDAAFKAAAPLRAELDKTRAALAAAVIASMGEGEINAATKEYGAAAASMTGLEMKTLAQILTMVKAEQRGSGATTAFFLMRGALSGSKKWDEVPDGRAY